MKKLSIFIVLLIGVIISAQVPRFAKYNIADTGAQFYFLQNQNSPKLYLMIKMRFTPHLLFLPM
jgi:hypothetical protein